MSHRRPYSFGSPRISPAAPRAPEAGASIERHHHRVPAGSVPYQGFHCFSKISCCQVLPLFLSLASMHSPSCQYLTPPHSPALGPPLPLLGNETHEIPFRVRCWPRDVSAVSSVESGKTTLVHALLAEIAELNERVVIRPIDRRQSRVPDLRYCEGSPDAQAEGSTASQ